MPARRRTSPLTIALTLALAASLAGFVAPVGAGAKGHEPAATAGGDAPAGNNGTIKIDEFVMEGGNRNRPHVNCALSVSFFGYDSGTQSATITLTPWAPTRGGAPLRLTTTWTTATRTGGNQFNKNVPISGAQVSRAFQGVTPAKQGFHARIDVTVTGSQGADGKHKMVWISPCAGSGSTTTTSVTSTTPPGGGVTTGTLTGGGVVGAPAVGPSGSGAVVGGAAVGPSGSGAGATVRGLNGSTPGSVDVPSAPAISPGGEVPGAGASAVSGVGVPAGEAATALGRAASTTG